MKELADSGKVIIGVKFDQPGIGFKGATDDMPDRLRPRDRQDPGRSLGIDPEDITWKETISDNREPFLQDGEVDLVIASYSITDERRQVVGQAGPYYVTGQQLLVESDSDIKSVDGPQGQGGLLGHRLHLARQHQGRGRQAASASTPTPSASTRCSDGTVDAMTTDGAILLGYAAENPDELKVVGEPFSEERYGVGYCLDNPEMCQWITDTLKKAEDDGDWDKAFEATLGKSGVETPEPPAMDECPAA